LGGLGLFFGDLQSMLQLAAEFFAVGEVELVLLDKELAIHLVGGVFDKEFVFVSGEDDAHRGVIALGVLLGGEIAEIQVHLADVVVFDIVDLEIDKNEAAEDAVVEDEIDAVVGVVQRDAVLSADEGEALANFKEEGLEVIAEECFQVGLGDGMRLGDLQELENVGVSEEVAGLGDDLTLRGELKDGRLVLACRDPEEERCPFLALEFTDGPFFPKGLLFEVLAKLRIEAGFC
jgi:hypothetical protein